MTRPWPGYEAAALKTSYTLTFLNFGQAVLITTGLVVVMLLAAIGVQAGELTIGDFVLVNAYMIQNHHAVELPWPRFIVKLGRRW